MDCGRFYFVYGYGGTGKTFLWRTLSASLRCEGKIVLNVASSGIASLFLPNGRTAHSKFKIPLNINEDSVCNLKQGSSLAKLVSRASLITWDEAPMLNKHCYEALDKSLKDILRYERSYKPNMAFAGKVVVLGGDFRQILPIIPMGSRQDIVQASINSSYLWDHCSVLNLTRNMCLASSDISEYNSEVNKFAKWLIQIGDGFADDSTDGESEVLIPDDMLINDTEVGFGELVHFVYPNIVSNLSHTNYFKERSILAPTLEVVNEVNNSIMSRLLMRLPPHQICLKEGVPVMLLRNIDQSNGLCNGTRIQVRRLGNHVIECIILTGDQTGRVVLIPRMDMIPNNDTLPFRFRRRQFSLIVSFAMTINKAQGQTLGIVGLFLLKPVFTHGQLYVALSRVKSKKCLGVLIQNNGTMPKGSTINVVFREIFNNIF
ncbi:uncharacterized protein LOC130949391 [Arachis stenosperma]|uniref:uncharacterized protein LOC130949391 n=1 Tax=Arachis stenosperma TaxID=217475 RepID=UPI0025ABFD88|nr:uncharacterized protein LOC130949391 [Arachis stenosperma]